MPVAASIGRMEAGTWRPGDLAEARPTDTNTVELGHASIWIVCLAGGPDRNRLPLSQRWARAPSMYSSPDVAPRVSCLPNTIISPPTL
jgi:hypothetical protein